MEVVACDFQYSGGLASACAVFGVASAALPLVLPLEPAVQAGLAATCGALAWRAVRGLDAWRRLEVHRDGSVALERRDGSSAHGTLAASCFVASWLTVVRWRPAGAWRDRALVIAPGATSVEAFRVLRVLLRLR